MLSSHIQVLLQRESWDFFDHLWLHIYFSLFHFSSSHVISSIHTHFYILFLTELQRVLSLVNWAFKLHCVVFCKVYSTTKVDKLGRERWHASRFDHLVSFFVILLRGKDYIFRIVCIGCALGVWPMRNCSVNRVRPFGGSAFSMR